jgi:hypothetical protein
MARLNAKAILFGVLVDIGTSLAVGFVAGIVAAVMHGGETADALTSGPFLVVVLTLGMAATLLGGFVAGRVAGARHALHGAIVGAIGVVFSLLTPGVPLPTWLVVTLNVLVIPVAVLGAMIAKWGSSAPETPPQALPSPVAAGSAAPGPPAAAADPGLPAASKPEPVGLGGWLILLVVGLFATPLRVLLLLLTDFLPLWTEGYWNELTSKESEAYSPYWAPLLVFEIVGNLLLASAAVYAIILFFRKSWKFPRVAIGLLLANLLFLGADCAATTLLPNLPADTLQQGLRDLFRSVVGCAIWVPYLLRSRRVRNTFVRPAEPAPEAPPLPQPIV